MHCTVLNPTAFSPQLSAGYVTVQQCKTTFMASARRFIESQAACSDADGTQEDPIYLSDDETGIVADGEGEETIEIESDATEEIDPMDADDLTAWMEAAEAYEAKEAEHLRLLAEAAADAPRAAAEAPASQDLREAVNGVRGRRAQVEGIHAPDDPSKKANRVMFVINNPDGYRPVFNEGTMNYMVWQIEKGEQGTPHIQGYVRFKNRMRLRTIEPLLGGRAWIKAARGNEQQCRDYCTKEDTRLEAGEEHGVFDPDEGKQGRRSDLEQIATDCAAGVPLKTIAAKNPGDWIRYHTGIESLHEQIAPKPPIQRDVIVRVLWGPTRTGKTHRVMTGEHPGGLYKVKPGRGPWDQYRGERTVFFDEFNFEKWDLFEMNEYLDKWQCQLPCRYRDKYAEWTQVVICANSSPLTWYPNHALPAVEAFRRRLADGCRHVTRIDQDITKMKAEPDFSPPAPPPDKPDDNPAPQA